LAEASIQLQGAKTLVVLDCTGVGMAPAEGLIDIPMQFCIKGVVVGEMGIESLACSFCSAIKASLKLGGVAGVLVGAI